MKFPRNAKIFRGHLDAAPFAGVFFLLLIFVLLGTRVYTPGIRLQLPLAGSRLPGLPGPALAVAVDKHGRIYFQSQALGTNEFRRRLAAEVARFTRPPTLVVRADREATREMLLQVADLAVAAGITNAVEETLPRIFDPRAGGKPAP